ncbi:hypothetical protein J5N97_022866 [Dioscorea zingiberensis]|uniref:DUF4283 domain-containing protein n=1 Tax=Dioscorea zingiberensis TaxID=325984 RepID=A0A9D5CBJ9_9LILI|nr:hypothetical protein J5N97_022866 [Dioscorea zingiberensis]
MASPALTLTFTPWTTNLYQPKKADGALRWVIVRNLPMFCWSVDSTARMLKPVGDLVHIGGQSGAYAEDIKVLLRIRRPRLLPCALHCSLVTLQHTYTVEMEPGQAPLPWDTCRGTEQAAATSILVDKSVEEPSEKTHNNPAISLNRRLEKGKAPISDVQVAPTILDGGRQRGLSIREPPESQQT